GQVASVPDPAPHRRSAGAPARDAPVHARRRPASLPPPARTRLPQDGLGEPGQGNGPHRSLSRRQDSVASDTSRPPNQRPPPFGTQRTGGANAAADSAREVSDAAGHLFAQSKRAPL